MPFYEYKCGSCNTVYTLKTIPIPSTWACFSCSGTVRRIFSFSIKSSFQPHFNPSVGKFVSSRNEYETELKILSERTTIATGLEHNFKSYDAQDHEAFGLTPEQVADGIETRERWKKDGKPPAPLILPKSKETYADNG